MDEDIFIVGKINLNGDKAPFLEIVLDNAEGRCDGEIILLKQVSTEDNSYFTKKIGKK